MHVRSAFLLVSMAIVGGPIAAQAQSADQVIDRYLDAIGGKKAVEQIQSSDVSGSITAADGRSGVFTQRTSRPHSLYVSLSWGDSRRRAGFNGRAAWQDDDVTGRRTLYGQAASRLRMEASYANAKYAQVDRVVQFAVEGREELRGRPVIVLIAVAPDGVSRRLFFDASSDLLVKDEQETEAGREERIYDDYRRVDGVLEPHRIEWQRNGQSLRIAVERITHNGRLDEQAFDVPAPPSEPALDVDAILSAAARNESRVDRVRDAYTYTQTSTNGRVDDRGQVTQQEGQTLEIFHLEGRVVSKLIRDRGGKALTEAERRREDERVKAIVGEYERQRLSGQPARRSQPSPAGRVLVWGPLGPVSIAAYSRLSDFSNARREQLGGRPVIVVEFQPKPRVAPNGDVERQASKLAGTLWIDEAAQHVIRIDSYFRDDENGNVEGSSLRMERTLVNDEVWLPSRFETNLRRSWAFGKLSTLLGVVDYSGYKKFTVETESTVTLPDAGR
jgi:hypothetical protein